MGNRIEATRTSEWFYSFPLVGRITSMNRYRLLIGLTIVFLVVVVGIGLATPKRELGVYSSGIPPAECHRPDGRIECPPGVTWPPSRPPR